MRLGVGDEQRYCDGDMDPLMRAAALGAVFDLRGDESDEKKFRAGPVTSDAKDRTEDRPGTVLMGEQDDAVPAEPPMTAL